MERIKFKINGSFWVFILAAVVFKQGYFAAMYTFAVILHETAHYIAASALFYRCKEIRLSVFGAVLYGDFQDVRGSDRIKIALAGPAANFILCLLCFALWWVVPDGYYFTESFFTANASMACINLLPCYPLDGGRVLCGLLDKKYADKALSLTKKFTVVFSLGLFGIFAVSLFTETKLFGLGLFAVGLFSGVLTQNGGECYVRSALTFNKKRFLKKGMEKKTLVFGEKSALRDVAKRMQGNYLYCLEVVDDNLNVVSRYNVSELESLVVENDLDMPLGGLKHPNSTLPK